MADVILAGKVIIDLQKKQFRRPGREGGWRGVGINAMTISFDEKMDHIGATKKERLAVRRALGYRI